MHAQRLGESGAFGGGATKPSAGVGGDTANEKPAVKFKSAKGAVDARARTAVQAPRVTCQSVIEAALAFGSTSRGHRECEDSLDA